MKRFRFDVLMVGENLWASNHLRFADEHDALVHARGMSSRWIVIEKMRITREGAPKGQPYVSGREHPDWVGPRVECAALNGVVFRIPDRGAESLRSRVWAGYEGDGLVTMAGVAAENSGVGSRGSDGVVFTPSTVMVGTPADIGC